MFIIIMENLKKIAIIIMIIQFTSFPLVSMILNSAVFIRNPDHDDVIFTQHLIKEVMNVKNAKRCADSCDRQAGCFSFFYDNVGQKCRLHNSVNFLAFDGISSHGWKFYVAENKECPVHLGFIHDITEGFCFHVPKTKYRFSDGQQYCSERNSALISLETEQKRNAFSRLIVRDDLASLFGDMILLGLHKTNGVWIWENGELLAASNWGSIEPYCPLGLVCECVKLIKFWPGHTWNDDQCVWENTIVCEYSFN